MRRPGPSLSAGSGSAIGLTLLESWNAGWTWVSPNILLSFVLIRLARPYVEILVRRYGWIALALLVLALLAAVPIAGPLVDYGAEGWLWALLGLCQRMYVDERSAAGAAQPSAPVAYAMAGNVGHMRLLACLVAAAAYIWQEQREYSFPQAHFAVFVVGVGILSLIMCLFRRGPSYLPTPAGRGRCPRLHRAPHSGDLRHPACRLRAHNTAPVVSGRGTVWAVEERSIGGLLATLGREQAAGAWAERT